MRRMNDEYLQPYRVAEQTHGQSFDVTLWASEASQTRRFAVMAQMVRLAGRRVLDAGCSRGDFAAWMNRTGVDYAHYTGVDGLAQVIAFAQQRGLPHSRFLTGDFVHNGQILTTDHPEIVTISGTLNTMDQSMAISVLEAGWAACSRALIFNFLSDRAGAEAPRQLDPARRLDTMQLLDWALQKTSSVQFRQDYFPFGHDATVAMRKDESTREM